MIFANLILNDLMTVLYRFIPFFFYFAPLTSPYSLYCVIRYVKNFKIRSAETVSEISQKSNVKVVTHVKRKSDQKVKRFFKKKQQDQA